MELDFGDIVIGDEGVEYVLIFLEFNILLKILNLNGNIKIIVVGWKWFGKVLKKNIIFYMLILDFNMIGDDGIVGFVSGLKDN